MENKNTFKDDIEKAERIILMYSWAGCIVSVGIIIMALIKF